MQVEKLRKGPWFEEEDERLNCVVSVMGERRWDSIAKASGLRRNGKSCRLRWMNYLRPNLKRGRLTAEEVKIVVYLHQQWGNKWSKIARGLPGRTDNEIKNYWRSHLRKRAQTQEKDDKNIKNTAEQEIYKENSRSARIKDDYVDETNGIFNDDEIFNTKDGFGDVNQLPSYELKSSPYENRLSNWLHEQNEPNNLRATLDLDFCYPAWSSGNGDHNTWQSSSSLWTD